MNQREIGSIRHPRNGIIVLHEGQDVRRCALCGGVGVNLREREEENELMHTIIADFQSIEFQLPHILTFTQQVVSCQNLAIFIAEQKSHKFIGIIYLNSL